MFKKSAPGFKPKGLGGPKAPGPKAPGPKPALAAAKRAAPTNTPPAPENSPKATTPAPPSPDSVQTPPPSAAVAGPSTAGEGESQTDGAAGVVQAGSVSQPLQAAPPKTTLPKPTSKQVAPDQAPETSPPANSDPNAIARHKAGPKPAAKPAQRAAASPSPPSISESPSQTASESSSSTSARPELSLITTPIPPTPTTPTIPAPATPAVESTTSATPISATPISASETSQPQTPAPTARAKPAPRGRKRQPASTPEDGTSTATQPRKRQRRTPAAAVEGEDAQPRPRRQRRARASTDNPEGGEVGGVEGETRTPGRRQRSATPEDAETQVVDPQALTMSDLTRDLHIGKKFSRHDELKERERQRKTNSRKKKDETPATGTPSPVEGEASGAQAGESPVPKSSVPDTSGVQFQIIDGQIVIDQNSLAVDRHARAAALNGELELTVEDDFTRLITSNSFRTDSKLRGPNYWSAADTELFYRGLRMFGTDFETIAKMFPGRTRRHVKMKFNREERKAPTFVDAALTGEKAVKMDVDEYKGWTGLELETVGDIMAEQDRRQAEYDAEEKRIADKKVEDLRKKRAALFADDDEEAAVDDAVAKAKKRKQKKLASYGDEVSIEAA